MKLHSAMLVLGIATSVGAQTYTLKVLHAFTGPPDGAYPFAGLVLDANGNLYGTTMGIDINCPPHTGGCGTVFKVSASGVEKNLYSFLGTPDGSNPQSVLVRDQKENLYGTTYGGGDKACEGTGCGTVFKIDPTGKEIILHSFTGTEGDGIYPSVGLRRDKKGNLYGTTHYGGSSIGCENGCGTVFKVDPTGTETVVYRFTGIGGDGAYPFSRLIGDGTGNLYGTTYQGGAYDCGTVFKLDPDYTETVLYSFTGAHGDGALPEAGLVLDAEGNMYGTTYEGGAHNYGTVFKLDTAGKETVLHSFNGKDGEYPTDLVRDKEGNLYGTAQYGGGISGFGTVFKVSSTGKETTLHTFKGPEGANPYAGLIQDGKGNFYGTTSEGGDLSCRGSYGCGTVFKLIPRAERQ
jgi:uncharacterized repeat protein (TIGR03803 family)